MENPPNNYKVNKFKKIVERFVKMISKNVGLLGLASAVIVWAIASLPELVSMVNRRHAEDSEHYPRFTDLTTAAVWFVVFMVAHAVSFLILGPTARKLISKKPTWSTEVWIAKLERFCSAIFQLGFSLTSTIILYVALRQTSWLPSVLGGSGSTAYCWADGFPFQTLPEILRKFYLVFIGYSSAEMVGHVIRERKRPDFYELLVHLLVTNVLLVFSYFCNYLRIGSLVMLAHSFSDIFVYLAKALVDTKITGGALSYIPLLGVYVWCRIYVHTAVILRSVWMEAPVLVSEENLPSVKYMNFLLSAILLLHMYWLFVIIKIGLFLVSTGKSRDMQASLSSISVRVPPHGGPSSGPSGSATPEVCPAPMTNGKNVVKRK